MPRNIRPEVADLCDFRLFLFSHPRLAAGIALEIELTGFEHCKLNALWPFVRDIPVDCRRVGSGSRELLLFTVDACSSSMDVAGQLAAEGRLPPWASVLAACQSAGRGQFGRCWYSPSGNIYGSLRLPRLGPPWADLAPLLLAESMRTVLESLGLAASIKWPNDLLIGGKKVGGILMEEKSGIVIAGLGLNLISAPPPHELRHPLALPAGSLREFCAPPAPREIWIPFVRDVRSRVRQTLMRGDPLRFVDSLIPNLAYIGESILLDAYCAADQPAIFQGLDASGAIKVLTTDGQRIFRSGSIYPVI